MAATNLTPFDPADYLDSDETIAEFLKAAAEQGDPAYFLDALGDVARARSMSQLASDTGLERAGLYKALSENGNPTLSTMFAVLKALNLKMSFEPA